MKHSVASRSAVAKGGGVLAAMVCGAIAVHVFESSRADSRYDRPALECEHPTKDFGETTFSQLEHVFYVKNHSSRSIRIERVGRSCGCMDVQIDRTVVEPGERIQVAVNAEIIPRTKGAVAQFSEELVLHWSSGGASHVLPLRMLATFVPPLYYLVSQVGIDAPRSIGEVFHASVEVFLNPRVGVKITNVSTSGDLSFTARIASRHTNENDGYERMVIAIDGRLDPGALPRLGTVEIATNSRAVPVVTIPVVLRTPPAQRISFSVDRIAFGIVPAGSAITRDLVVRLPRGGKYQFKGASSPHPAVTVSSHVEKDRTIVLRCELNARSSGSIEGEVLVTISNGGREEIHTIPFSCFVKGDGRHENGPSRADGSLR